MTPFLPSALFVGHGGGYLLTVMNNVAEIIKGNYFFKELLFTHSNINVGLLNHISTFYFFWGKTPCCCL